MISVSLDFFINYYILRYEYGFKDFFFFLNLYFLREGSLRKFPSNCTSEYVLISRLDFNSFVSHCLNPSRNCFCG